MSAADQDQLDRLRLIRSANIGPISYRQLLTRFGSASAALDAIPALTARAGGRAPKLTTPEEVQREWSRVIDLGARYVFLGDPDYPALLAELDTAPPALIIKGDLSLVRRPCVAMVGARNASASACRFARELAANLADKGVSIVSGLARGIDAHAHHGSLKSGTIGVIASGIDVTYPPEHADLQSDVAEHGLLVTEQTPGREPLARHFPARNRIIAGLAHGTVVVEAAPKSGSLITARLANEAGRDVMAVPGSPLDPRAQGCNHLIREGAIRVQNSDDILEVIQMFNRGFEQSVERYVSDDMSADPNDRERANLTALLSPVPVPVDELIRQSGFAAPLVYAILLELELVGRLERHAGGRVSLI